MRTVEEFTIDTEKYDSVTRSHLLQAAPLLHYRANNKKMLHMHQSIAKTRLILGGKRSGKTTFGVVETCWIALGYHPYLEFDKPPLQIRVCSVDFVNGVRGILLPMFKEWLPRQAWKHYWPEPRVLELTNGTEIEFRSYDQELLKFEGVARHFVWMDEEPPKDIYQSNFMRTISSELNGKLLITCTPLHGMTWLYDDLYDNPDAVPPAVEHCHVKTYENPHIGEDAIEAVRRDPAMRDNLEAALEGEFIPKSGLVFKGFGDHNIIEPIGEIPEDWMVMIGIDPHDRNPHGVIFVALDKDNNYIVFDEILWPGIIKELGEKIKAKLGKRFPPQLAVMDTYGNIVQGTSGKSFHDQLVECGLYTLDANKDVQAGRMRMNTVLWPDPKTNKPQLYITRNCVNIMREFRHHIWEDWARNKDSKDPKEKVVKKDDHLLDALRYVLMLNIVYRHPGFAMRPKTPDTISPVTGYFMGR